MSVEVFRIKRVLAGLAQIAWDEECPPGWGNPMSHLVRHALQYPLAYEGLCERIAGGKRVEYRLNGAGLKLFTRPCSVKTKDIRIRVAGDQTHKYPAFVEEANIWLESQGY